MIEKGRVISLISSAAGLLLAVGSMTVFSACGPKEDGTLMICHNAQIRVAMCGIGLAVLFAIAAFVKSKAIKLICDTAALVLSVVTFMTPGVLVHICHQRLRDLYRITCPVGYSPDHQGEQREGTGRGRIMRKWIFKNRLSKGSLFLCVHHCFDSASETFLLSL